MSDFSEARGLISLGSAQEKYLCLTICGYRKQGMSEEAYRNHMVNISAPMTKGLMVKYGVKRWTQVSKASLCKPHYRFMLMGEDPQLQRYTCLDVAAFRPADVQPSRLRLLQSGGFQKPR